MITKSNFDIRTLKGTIVKTSKLRKLVMLPKIFIHETPDAERNEEVTKSLLKYRNDLRLLYLI